MIILRQKEFGNPQNREANRKRALENFQKEHPDMFKEMMRNEPQNVLGMARYYGKDISTKSKGNVDKNYHFRQEWTKRLIKLIEQSTWKKELPEML